MSNTIKVASETGEELLLSEIMTISLDETVGDLEAGTEVLVYSDKDNNIYPMIQMDEDELKMIEDQEALAVITETLDILMDQPNN